MSTTIKSPRYDMAVVIDHVADGLGMGFVAAAAFGPSNQFFPNQEMIFLSEDGNTWYCKEDPEIAIPDTLTQCLQRGVNFLKNHCCINQRTH